MITNQENDEFQVIDTKQLAERWDGKWSTRTLANWRAGPVKRGPPFYKIRGKVVYKLNEVIKWEERQHQVPEPDPHEVHI